MALNTGTEKAYPILKATGPGPLTRMLNLTTEHRIDFDILLQDGEVAVLDLRPGFKTFTSTFRGPIGYAILPGSDTDIFHLAPGENSISIFIDDPLGKAQLTWSETHTSYAGIASNE